MAIDERYRLNIAIPAFHKQWLLIWAYLKGVSPTGLAGNILQARIETNLDQIMLMLESRANDLGLTSEELKNKIINNNDTKD